MAFVPPEKKEEVVEERPSIEGVSDELFQYAEIQISNGIIIQEIEASLMEKGLTREKAKEVLQDILNKRYANKKMMAGFLMFLGVIHIVIGLLLTLLIARGSFILMGIFRILTGYSKSKVPKV